MQTVNRSPDPTTDGPPFTSGFDLPALLATKDLEALGIGPGRIRGLVRRGQLLRLRRGLYTWAEDDAQDTGRASGTRLLEVATAAAIRRLREDAWASHDCATAMFGITPTPTPAPVVLTVNRPCGPVRSYANNVHVWPAQLPEHHRTDTRGIPTVTPARAVVDACRHRDFPAAQAVVDVGLRLGLCTPADLAEVIDHCAGWPGVVAARRAVGHGNGARDSYLESASFAFFVDRDLPLPLCNPTIRDDWGAFVARPDFAWDGYAVVGEADGAIKYLTDLAGAAEPHRRLYQEKLRQEALEQLGYTVVRWTWDELVHRPDLLERRIRRALGLRAG
ncbi:MAG: type IV toxin-antitoxin system AbiEi family antitoxin domain-containing protein [Nocardioidaceae bacterium]